MWVKNYSMLIFVMLKIYFTYNNSVSNLNRILLILNMINNTPYIANLVNSIIGVSVLASPFCMKKCGLVLGLTMLLASCWLTYITCSMLLSSAMIKRKRSYEYLASSTIGL